MKPVCKNEQSLFYRYLYFVFTPKLVKDHRDFGSCPMTGSISLERIGVHKGVPFTCLYCSPMWEGDVDGIVFEFYHAENDTWTTDSVGFPLNDWTMEVDKDVNRYVEVVSNFLRNNTQTA